MLFLRTQMVSLLQKEENERAGYEIVDDLRSLMLDMFFFCWRRLANDSSNKCFHSVTEISGV